jgi:hypothetical protein
MQYDEGLASLEIGRHLPPEDNTRKDFITRGAAIFSQIGAEYDLERAKDLL